MSPASRTGKNATLKTENGPYNKHKKANLSRIAFVPMAILQCSKNAQLKRFRKAEISLLHAHYPQVTEQIAEPSRSTHQSSQHVRLYTL